MKSSLVGTLAHPMNMVFLKLILVSSFLAIGRMADVFVILASFSLKSFEERHTMDEVQAF